MAKNTMKGSMGKKANMGLPGLKGKMNGEPKQFAAVPPKSMAKKGGKKGGKR
jgi:hypothetical protein